jgi:hypothetical protein
VTPAAALPLAAAPGPWFFATLVLPCRKCGMAPGEPCIGPRGGTRQRFHLQRYEDAREAAGFPVKRTLPERPRTSSPQGRYGEWVEQADSESLVEIERPQRPGDAAAA